MPPELRAWMRPDDLVLFQLDQLPWPAYIRLLEHYFKEHGFRVKLIASEPSRTEFLLVSLSGARHLLHCCSVQAAQRSATLALLRSHMDRCCVQEGMLASPKGFSVELTGAAREAGVELFSGNRLRAKIEMMVPDLRRAVLDSIRSKPEFEGTLPSDASLSERGPTGRSTLN